jgi:hypothetical protein
LALRINSWFVRCVAALWLCFVGQLGLADTVYQTPEDFLHEVFGSEIKPSLLWLDKTAQESVTAILGHAYPQARLRYWRKATVSVWILEEIGKEYPITAGFVITENKISRAQVLIYRESRGAEIHLPAFLAQFKNLALGEEKFSDKIDSIAGATLSVNAMVKMAKVCLVLNKLTENAQVKS